jgi:hypothetical protein
MTPGLPRRTAKRTHFFSNAARSPVVVPLQHLNPVWAERLSPVAYVISLTDSAYGLTRFETHELNSEATFEGALSVLMDFSKTGVI